MLSVCVGPWSNLVGTRVFPSVPGDEDFRQGVWQEYPALLCVDVKGAFGHLAGNALVGLSDDDDEEKEQEQDQDVAWDGQVQKVHRVVKAAVWTEGVKRSLHASSLCEMRRVKPGAVPSRDFLEDDSEAVEELQEGLRRWSERIDCLQKARLLWDGVGGWSRAALCISEYWWDEHPKLSCVSGSVGGALDDYDFASGLVSVGFASSLCVPVANVQDPSSDMWRLLGPNLFAAVGGVARAKAVLSWSVRQSDGLSLSSLYPSGALPSPPLLSHYVCQEQWHFGQSRHIGKWLKSLEQSLAAPREDATREILNALALQRELYE